MADNKKYGPGALAAALIIGLAAGAGAGFWAGSLRSQNVSGNIASYAADADQESEDIMQETGDLSDAREGTDSQLVLTIDGTEIYMDEINTRVYLLRDSCVSQYGEEPWSIELDSGLTVGQQAKENLMDEVTREIILAEHAGEYGIDDLTDEEETDCEQRARDYVNDLGQDIADQFGITYESMQTIYERETLEMDVYNAVLEDLESELQEDYPDLSETEMDDRLMTAFDELYAGWREEAEIEPEDSWNNLEFGAMG